MYTLHGAIGVNWDIYVPWTDDGLKLIVLNPKVAYTLSKIQSLMLQRHKCNFLY